ncbi:hypothetical protein I2I05_03525 [Hymenobacter sp. BT683]|uniref:PsbP C-terminal domain-containing protein n=1 Tax=Hymenobacter jeongseonensis TaxID=2791027 RepID=A0ABS0IDP6_9BACT|nr:hypothetical protein [Hymenobacter jeongseonensis]MBF9236458.1 hypothetical protein [Hymenobacter jeongseonensis]
MFRSLFALMVGCLLLAGPVAAQKIDGALATAPAGFHWQPLPEVKAAMLLPDGWYYKAELGKDTQAYFLTQEEIVEGGEFQTGLSLNVVQKVQAKTNRKAADYARAFSARAGLAPTQEVLDRKEEALGPLRLFRVRYRAAPADASPKIICQWAIANTKTDTFYMMVFESPEKEWAEAWQLGETMVRELVLDSKQ